MTIIARCNSLLDDLYLTIESRRSTLNQRYIRSHAHSIDVSPCIEIIQRVEHHIEAFEPSDIELGIFDVGVVGFELNFGVELVGCLFCYLMFVSALPFNNIV